MAVKGLKRYFFVFTSNVTYVSVVLLSVMCDDSCEVYADGFLIGSTSTYEELGQFSISQSTRVIAIEADDVGKASGDWRLFGLIVRIKEFISDKSWMCSRDVTHGWNQPVYTMSRSWQRAKTRRKTVQYTPSLFGDVKWIWGSPVNPVFCRGDYSKWVHSFELVYYAIIYNMLPANTIPGTNVRPAS